VSNDKTPEHKDMTMDKEQAEMKLKASMPKNVNLHLSSTSSATVKVQVVHVNPRRGGDQHHGQAFNKEARDELDFIIARIFHTGELLFNLRRNS